MTLARFLALSLLVHALLLLVPPVLVRKVAPRREAIRIRIAERAAVEAPPPPKPAPGGRPAGGGRPRVVPGIPAPAVAAAEPAPPPGPASRLEDLLPGGTYQFSSEGARAGAAPGAAVHNAIPTALRITSDQISGKLDVPLVFRKKNGASKAVAKVVKKPGDTFVFEYIDGDPYMRAVLFEALRDGDGRAQVLRLFASMRSAEIVIVLKQTVVQGGAPTGETFEDFAVDGYKLTISKTTVLGMTSGMMLPDADAEKAKRRDEGHLDRIKTSPAFISPIRNQSP